MGPVSRDLCVYTLLVLLYPFRLKVLSSPIECIKIIAVLYF